jgi:Bacterial TSP3 repeat
MPKQMFYCRKIFNFKGKTGIPGRLFSPFLFLLLYFSQSAIAGYKDDIGFTALQAQLGAGLPTGSGVPVMHVEAATSFVDHDNDPATPDYPVYLPDNANAQFSTKTISDKSNLTSGSYSGHATSVGTYIYGNTSSIASGIATINAYWADAWLQGNYLQFGGNKPLTTSDRVSNFSWIGTVGTAEDAEILRRSDWVVDTDEMVMCVGIRNSTGPNSSLLSGAFNVIAIGKSDGVNGYGTNQLDANYVSGRVRPEIVVPLSTSSSATGLTSSAVSLLIETSQANPGLANDPVETSTTNRNGDTIYNTGRSEVIKSVLMAGAERITSNTTGNDITDYRVNTVDQTSNGLDIRYGAGQLNILNSYNIIIAGEQNSDEDDGAGSGAIAESGFDYDPSFGGGNSSNITASYYFNTNNGGSYFSTTLAWNININGGNGPSFSGTAEFYDLDLTLYDVTSGQVLVVESNSTIDNSESIWAYLPQNKNYLLQVTIKSGQNQFEWDYALAWQLALVIDSDGDGLNDYIEGLIGTDPLLADTDGDGVTDYDEVNWDGNPDEYDPVKDLNPLSADTDGDSITDAMEINTGNNPLDIADFPVWGDINDDGLVNAVDVLLTTRSVLGNLILSSAQLARGNVAPLVAGAPVYDPAGPIDTADLLLIQRKAFNLVSY